MRLQARPKNQNSFTGTGKENAAGAQVRILNLGLNFEVRISVWKFSAFAETKISVNNFQLNLTYSKFKGCPLIPRIGGAIQLANLPSSTTRPTINDCTKA
jgi:hypothetical protein